jgi:predicted nucleotidyltransferase
MRMDKIIIDQTGIKQQVINEICELAQKYNVEQVLLFGSRSRGDYKSDIDLAVRGGDIDRFALDVEEETATLLEYDIVDLDEPMQPELLESIQKEGKIIYEIM